jgi:hypothetical protein
MSYELAFFSGVFVGLVSYAIAHLVVYFAQKKNRQNRKES